MGAGLDIQGEQHPQDLNPLRRPTYLQTCGPLFSIGEKKNKPGACILKNVGWSKNVLEVVNKMIGNVFVFE